MTDEKEVTLDEMRIRLVSALSAQVSVHRIKNERIEMATLTKQPLLTIKRHSGHEIILPENMDVPKAILQLGELNAWLSQKTDRIRQYRGWHVKDVTVAVNTAIERTFGYVKGKERVSMFGTTPPRMERVQVGKDEWRDCVVFDAALPAWDGTIRIPFGDGVNDVSVVVTTSNKWLSAADAMLDMVETIMQTESIFKGKAIDGAFNFIDLNSQRSPTFDPATARTIEATVYAPLRHGLVLDGRRTKRGVLLVGPYGTGKTLTAAKAAEFAGKAGVTFMYVSSDQADNLSNILRVSLRYAPLAVFLEDVDTVAQGERSLDMNGLLNLLDGIDTKGSAVMFMFSTNHIERIHPAFLRPGRMDAVITLTYPDVPTRIKILSEYSGLTEQDCETAAAYAQDGQGQGFSGAELAEAAARARLYLLADDRKTLTPQDLVDAVQGLIGQVNLARADKHVDVPALDGAMRAAIRAELQASVPDMVEEAVANR